MISRFLLAFGRRIATLAAFLIPFLAVCLPASAAVEASSVEASAVSTDQGRTAQVIQRPTKPAVDVQWKAAASKRGSFRLYRGAAFADLQLIWEEAARRGTHDYSYQDLGSGMHSQVYELRYVEPNGHEVVLQTVVLIPQEIEASGGITSWAQVKDGVLASWTEMPPEGEQGAGLRTDLFDDGLRLEPSVPPPRSIEAAL